MSEYTVLHGFQASAGQPGTLARALRGAGVDATSVIVGPNKLGYQTDFHFPGTDATTMRSVLAEFAARSSIVHIHAIAPFTTMGRVAFPMGTDLLALRAAGTRIVMHFRGSEIRMASLFKRHSPYHYVDDDPEGLFGKFSESWQQQYLSMCRALSDEIVVTDPELATYVPGAKILPRALDLDLWQQVPIVRRPRPVVVHAPTRPGVKGTHHVLAAVEALKSEGLDFDFRLVQGLSNAEARQVYEEADIVVDQLRIGWYGVLAVEAMALGKPVVSYIRDDLSASFDGPLPVATASPDSVQDVLRRLLLSPDEREELGAIGREYCVKVHDSVRVAEKTDTLYQGILAAEPAFRISDYLAENHRQELALQEMLAAAKKRGAKNAAAAAAARAGVGATAAISAVNATPIAAAASVESKPRTPSVASMGRVISVYRSEGPLKFTRRAPARLAQLVLSASRRLRRL